MHVSPLLDRELSLLEFNRRVLHEALDSRTALLERVRFLEIFSSNMDEFFMKRVGGLKRQALANVASGDGELQSPQEQLREIRRAVIPLVDQRVACFVESIRPELRRAGIHLLSWEELTPADLEFVNRFFRESVFPVLTPLAVDPGHPFPFISHLSTSLGILMAHPQRADEELFARIKIPSIFPAWIPLPAENGDIRFASLYEVIGRNLGMLFPGMTITDVMIFRVTRNADVEKEQEDADDLLELVAEELRERRFGQVVRLEHGPDASPKILKILTEELEVTADDIYELPLWLEFFALGPIADVNLPALKDPPWVPSIPAAFSDPDGNIFEIIRQTDILVHHPYESFTASVERFIRTAAEDPKVIAIKMTLYRTGEGSPFIPLLIKAAERGKQVACLVELKARMDEERNIAVAQALEKAGVHVVYGIMGLKTHSKIALVVRQESDGVRSYVHIGTGNYHARTARLYTDLGLFTAKPAFTEDVVHLFHYLTGRSLEWRFTRLLVAPVDMRESFLRMIERERRIAKAGGHAHIVAKMNNLQDRPLIEALYAASSDGVKIDLIVRSICCLRPGVPGLSENIRVISVLGRFLEHSRVFYFRNGAETPEKGEIFMGSADWMYRNLSARVEAVVPVEEPALRQRLWEILDLMLRDRRRAWDMQPDGSYVQRRPLEGEDTEGSQYALMRLTQERNRP